MGGKPRIRTELEKITAPWVLLATGLSSRERDDIVGAWINRHIPLASYGNTEFLPYVSIDTKGLTMRVSGWRGRNPMDKVFAMTRGQTEEIVSHLVYCGIFN